MTLDLEAVEIAGLLQTSLNVIKEKAYKHRIKLKLDLPGDAGQLMVDARKLKQIVYNLLSNAVKFTDDGGEIRVSSRAVRREDLKLTALKIGAVRQLPLPDSEFEKFLEIKVCDSGIGIAGADLPRLFQAFLQLDSSLARTTEGTGLGLALVSRLVELHGGTVAVASAPGHGSCFAVWLPWRNVQVEAGKLALLTADTPSDASAPPQRAVEAMPVNSASTRRALVIEDDARAAEILCTHLEKAGFQVACASDAVRGLKMAEQEPPDLITLDLLMPGMNGWEALERIKANPALCSVPVVIVSVIADQTKGFVLGAAQVLQKPVAGKTLLNTIGELGLAGEIGQPLSVLVVGDDPQAVEMAEACLDGQNYNVLRAYGNEAIKAAQALRPDLVILDLLMSDSSGFDVVEALQSRQDTADVPILIVTSKAITKADRKRLNGYVLTVMEKERFAPEHFLAEVERALHGRC
jgi:CheY-like chemotaxis protein/two-component sensor histidine kinase